MDRITASEIKARREEGLPRETYKNDSCDPFIEQIIDRALRIIEEFQKKEVPEEDAPGQKVMFE